MTSESPPGALPSGFNKYSGKGSENATTEWLGSRLDTVAAI
jgi:hypothetical protein